MLRHVVYWTIHIIVWGFLRTAWALNFFDIWRNMLTMLIWVPLFILYAYPLIYLIVPKFLLKARYKEFAFIILLWGIAGLFLIPLFKAYILIPIQEYLNYNNIYRELRDQVGYLCMTITAAEALILTLFKYWMKKQQDWMQAEKEKVVAELQLLKAQVHPHFLFNTLNNIYSFSYENSPKTPGLILKLSSLLSYMLYDCKAEEVLLEKEIEIMKNYIDLEKERYGNKIEISINIEGDVQDKYIAPLLLLPFLENAFKHGTSDQLEKPWLSIDLAVKQHTLKCKIVNSKDEFARVSENGIGIDNVKKRLAFIYPDKYDLKISDEASFYVVSLLIDLWNHKVTHRLDQVISFPLTEKALL